MDYLARVDTRGPTPCAFRYLVLVGSSQRMLRWPTLSGRRLTITRGQSTIRGHVVFPAPAIRMGLAPTMRRLVQRRPETPPVLNGVPGFEGRPSTGIYPIPATTILYVVRGAIARQVPRAVSRATSTPVQGSGDSAASLRPTTNVEHTSDRRPRRQLCIRQPEPEES